MQWRINGQYIMEGLASSFLFTLGGVGFIILDRTNAQVMPKINRVIMILIGSLSVLISFFTSFCSERPFEATSSASD